MKNIEEEWRIIKEFPRYSISDKGNVKSDVSKESVILQPNIIKGYEYVKLYKYNSQKMSECKLCAVHRLVAQYFCEGFTQDKEVHHTDTNCRNNNCENLVCLTPEEHREEHKKIKEAKMKGEK